MRRRMSRHLLETRRHPVIHQRCANQSPEGSPASSSPAAAWLGRQARYQLFSTRSTNAAVRSARPANLLSTDFPGSGRTDRRPVVLPAGRSAHADRGCPGRRQPGRPGSAGDRTIRQQDEIVSSVGQQHGGQSAPEPFGVPAAGRTGHLAAIPDRRRPQAGHYVVAGPLRQHAAVGRRQRHESAGEPPPIDDPANTLSRR